MTHGELIDERDTLRDTITALRAELAAATAEVERAAYQRHKAEERADFEARRRGQVDATWRKMWDESVGKIARGEALLAPTPPIVINDPSGFVANQARDLAAARAELAAVTERAERAELRARTSEQWLGQVLENARCDGGESDEHAREECDCDRDNEDDLCMCAAHVAGEYLAGLEACRAAALAGRLP